MKKRTIIAVTGVALGAAAVAWKWKEIEGALQPARRWSVALPTLGDDNELYFEVKGDINDRTNQHFIDEMEKMMYTLLPVEQAQKKDDPDLLLQLESPRMKTTLREFEVYFINSRALFFPIENTHEMQEGIAAYLLNSVQTRKLKELISLYM